MHVQNKVMDTKLTLKLDKDVIEQAKNYASVHKRSLSRIIEGYLKTLIDREKNEDESSDLAISPFVKSISTSIHIPAGLDYKSGIVKHIEDKHK